MVRKQGKGVALHIYMPAMENIPGIKWISWGY